jgi:hypothetical protein
LFPLRLRRSTPRRIAGAADCLCSGHHGGKPRLLSSHVWRQDHNGFSHQDPGFIDHVVNKKAEIIRVYLPPDANCLLSVADHCLRSRHYVNVVVAGKQPSLSYLTMDEAIAHCTRGIGIWDWASTDDGGEPDVVLGCAGDIPTLETVAAAAILRERLPELKVRVINVVDLMRLQDDTEHPHGLSHGLFTTDKPVIFAYHGYPWLIHRPPRDGRHRPRPGPGPARGAAAPGDRRRAPAHPRLHPRTRRRPRRRARLGVAGRVSPRRTTDPIAKLLRSERAFGHAKLHLER